MLTAALAQSAQTGGNWLQTMLGDDMGVVGMQILQIIGIDILLAGDNAVVIALACRSLPEKQRKWGIILGAGVAVAMRILFAGTISALLQIPFLKLVGGLLLFWVAIKLLSGNGESEHTEIADSTHLWGAVRTVAIADLVMSLDNVIAIAAAAKGNVLLIAFGLVVSIPLIVAGATLVMAILTRFPILVWAGAALLGWIAGELIAAEPATYQLLERIGNTIGLSHQNHSLEYAFAAVGAAFVILAGWLLTRRSQRAAH